MKQRNIIALIMIIGLSFTALSGEDPAFAVAQVKLAFQRSQAIEQGRGEAVIMDSTLTIRVWDLKPHSVYTVWYVNTDPEHIISGVGQRPYMFKTDRKGAATFKAKLDEQPFGTWQMLVIIRHPNGDPQDMQHVEDALWASLSTPAWKAATNPCAAKNPCAIR